MNHPEFRPIIVLDDTAFEIADSVKVTTVRGNTYIGLISYISEKYFNVKGCSAEHVIFYEQVASMELIQISRKGV